MTSRPDQAGDSERPAGSGRVARALYSLLRVFYRWAESGWGGSAVAGWGFLQAALVPGPTDAVLVPLGLSDPRRAYRLAAFAVLGSVLGGVVAYAVGSGALGNFAPWLLETMGMTPAAIEVSRGVFESRGWLLVLASTVSPLSAKMVSIAAGAFGLPFWQFLLAIVAGRTVRNVVLAAILRRAGPALQRRLNRSLNFSVPGAAVAGTSPSGVQT